VAEGATTSERPSEESASAPRAGLFVAVSSFQIANGTTAAVKQAFLERPHLVDDAPGFIRMDVISPVDAPHEIWLLTYWTDEASYRTWHKSHHYRDSHRGIPKGTKLVPKSATVRFFEHVAS
jgi:heme-degrading monooxygenase HmoA